MTDTDRPDVAALAAALHDAAHAGWHKWSPEGTDCPDGKLDADAWLRQAPPIIAALAALEAAT